MKIIEDPYVNEMVKLLYAPSIMEKEGFVIAGGCVSALYDFHLMSKEQKKKILNISKLSVTTKNIPMVSQIFGKIGDIDYWILKGSEADKLLSPFTEVGDDGKLRFVEANDASRFLDKIFKGLHLHKVTRFAISFNGGYRSNKRGGKYHDYKHQIIRHETYNDISDIFEGYDLSISQAAWKDGKLYISPQLEYDFSQSSFTLNKDVFSGDSTFQRVWTTMRIIKYYQRYGFEPSKKIVDQMHQVFSESIDFLDSTADEQNKSYLKNLFGNGFSLPSNANHLKTLARINVTKATQGLEPYDALKQRSITEMRGLYQQLQSQLGYLLLFENYTVFQAAQLVNIQSEDGRGALRDFLDERSKTASKLIPDKVNNNNTKLW